MQKYAELTGDWDGVEEVDGKVRGKCFSEHFWFPPLAGRIQQSVSYSSQLWGTNLK